MRIFDIYFNLYAILLGGQVKTNEEKDKNNFNVNENINYFS